MLFILIDQARADCLEGKLADFVKLPCLSELKRDATSFSRHYTVTSPCGPSRASLLTGLYAMNHRSVRNRAPLRSELTNLALEVRKSGYEPLLFGYTDTSPDPRSFHPKDPHLRSYERPIRGFTEVVEMRMETGSYPWKARLAALGYELPEFEHFYMPREFDDSAGPRPDDPAFYKSAHSDTAFLTDEVLNHLRARHGQMGWFAHVTYVRPHPPLIAPEPYNRMFSPDQVPLAERMKSDVEEADSHPFLAAQMNKNYIKKCVHGDSIILNNRNSNDVAVLRAVYLGLLAEVDFHIGRIVNFLKETGQFENTLIVISGDHGEMLGDHYDWGKTTLYEAAYHCPLIIRDPYRSEKRGQVMTAFTESIDITPTILEWTGTSVPRGMNGHSLLTLLEGEMPGNWRDYTFAELDFGEPDHPTIWQRQMGLDLREANLAIVREDRYKLVHFNGGLPPLLFDMHSPERENCDLAGDPAHADTLLRLTRKMLDHRMSHADHAISDFKVTEKGTVNYP